MHTNVTPNISRYEALKIKGHNCAGYEERECCPFKTLLSVILQSTSVARPKLCIVVVHQWIICRDARTITIQMYTNPAHLSLPHMCT
jgi:hypothetical protein